MNILDAIRHHARMRPFDIAVIHAGGVVTYRQLASAITNTQLALRSRGVQPGRTLGIYVSDPFMHLLLIYGAYANGTVTVSAHPNYDPMPAAAEVDIYAVDRPVEFAKDRSIAVGPNWIQDVMKDTPVMPESGFTDETAVMRLYTSSGTTGTAKVIGYSGANGELMSKSNNSFDPYARGPVLSMMWLSTIGGHGTANSALWRGITLVLMSAPLPVLRAINLYKVTNLRASPQQVQGLLEVIRNNPVRFPSLERIELGGSSIPSAVLLAVRATLCPNVNGVYGSTEAGLIAQAPTALLQSVPDAAGYVVPDVEIRIVNDEGTALGHDKEGIVQVRSPGMADRYIGDPVASAAAFRDGWFIPGDLGVLRADGMLRITGRVDEVINAGGVKLNPAIVDEFLIAQPGVVDAAAFAFRQTGMADQVWAAIVGGPDFNEQAVLAAARQKLNSRAPVKLVRLTEIPRNQMGKAMRQKLSQDALIM